MKHGLRRHDRWWLALALALLAGTLAALQATWRLDRLVYDLSLAWWSRPPPPLITVIAIDDASIEAIGRWPWRRAVHATLLQRLAEARPKAIALDLVLSEDDPDPAQDALLAQALRRAAPVVLPVPWVSVGGAAPRWLDPAPPLAQAALLASAEADVDDDGVLRTTFLGIGPPQAQRPHAALALLQAAGEAPHPRVQAQARSPGTSTTPWQRSGRLLIRYGGPPGHVEQLSYVDVLRGAVPAERLQGRYLLVGMTAQGLGDTLATPVNADQRSMAGVEVLAQTLHMLRSGDTLREVQPLPLAAWSALLVGAGVLALSVLGQRAALGLALGGAVAIVLGSVAALGAGWWLPPTPALVATLLAYPLWSWRRLEAAVAGLDTEIRLLGADGGSPPQPGASDPLDARLQRLHDAAGLLREARRYLADTLESLPTAMLVADAQGRVLQGNAGAAALFEVGDPDELAGLELVRLLQEFQAGEPPDWAAVLGALQPGGEQPAFQAHMPDKGDFVVQLSAADLAGSRRVLVSMADVAPVKRAERQREEALAFVSHDLRSPASAIVLLADTVLAGEPGRAADWLPEVRRLAQRSLQLSEAFVRYAQADLAPTQLAPVALHALAHEAAAGMAAQAAASGLVLQVQVVPADAVCTLDAALVGRALANLLGNALRHSPAGGCVRLHAALEHGAAVFVVSDDGPGLSAAQQQQLHAGDDGLPSGHAAGLGLGLRFVQRVARRHRGRLRWRAVCGAHPAGFELRLGDMAHGAP